MQVHKSTGETQFSLKLSLNQQNPAVTAETPPPVYLVHADVRQVKLAVPRRAVSLVDKSTESLLSSKAKHKRFFHPRLRQSATPQRSQHVLVGLTPHQTNSTNRLKKTAAMYDAQSKLLQKLLPKYDDPFRVVSSAPSTVTIDIDAVHDIVSIDRVPIDPRGNPDAPKKIPTTALKKSDTRRKPSISRPNKRNSQKKRR